MDHRPSDHGAAREVAGLLATLVIVLVVGVVLSLGSLASPPPEEVPIRQAAPAVFPAAVNGKSAPAAPAPRVKRSARVRLGRLRPLRDVKDWRRLGFQWPTTGWHQITSPFGPRDGGLHHGADVGCAIGQPLYASRAGRVIGVGDGGPGYGLAILIDHGSGYQTLYSHFSKLQVQYGQGVRTREQIGLCGDSGNASGPHVHFEMRYGGYVWDPVKFLP